MLDPNIEDLAAELAAVFYRQTEQRKVHWGHMAPADRTLWRVIARTAQHRLLQCKSDAVEPTGDAANDGWEHSKY